MRAHHIAEWIRQRLTPEQLADVAAQRALVGDLIELPDWWEDEEVIEAVELLSAQPPRFKVVPTPDHGTRLVPVDPTPKTEDEWLAAACEHDITYGQDSTPHGSHTPGPWELRGCRLVTDRHGVVIAEGISANHPGTPQANARLIAAAPELLAALEAAVSYLEVNRPTGKIREIYSLLNEYENGVMKPARAAIAKATGH